MARGMGIWRGKWARDAGNGRAAGAVGRRFAAACAGTRRFAGKPLGEMAPRGPVVRAARPPERLPERLAAGILPFTDAFGRKTALLFCHRFEICNNRGFVLKYTP